MAKKEGENASLEALAVEIEKSEKNEKQNKKRVQTVAELSGVGEATARKLEDAGYNTLQLIAVSMPAELAEVAGIGEGTAIKVINSARQALEMGYETGDKVLERRLLVDTITTG